MSGAHPILVKEDNDFVDKQRSQYLSNAGGRKSMSVKGCAVFLNVLSRKFFAKIYRRITTRFSSHVYGLNTAFNARATNDFEVLNDSF
jgi:hypothetical protein